MIKKAQTAMLVLFSIFIFSVATYANSENIVASLDDENITEETLTIYVEEVAGKNYEPWLRNKEGLRKLADFYINRTLLLEYARQTVDKKNTIVKNHSVRSVDEDVMLLTSLLQTEVQDKVQVTDEEVYAYMQENVNTSEKKARQMVESGLKNERMDTLVTKVRTGHVITYY